MLKDMAVRSVVDTSIHKGRIVKKNNKVVRLDSITKSSPVISSLFPGDSSGGVNKRELKRTSYKDMIIGCLDVPKLTALSNRTRSTQNIG